MVHKSWRSALLGSGAAVALLAASVPASADEIDELRSQIQSLQDKMSQLEKSQISKRRVAPAAAVESGSKPPARRKPAPGQQRNAVPMRTNTGRITIRGTKVSFNYPASDNLNVTIGEILGGRKYPILNFSG